MAKNRRKIGRGDELSQLTHELGLIAKQSFPLDPANLAGRVRLLGCPAVLDRATAGAQADDLAVCASLAIPLAIETLKDETNLGIARAMFALSASYQGKQVSARKELLEATEHISRYTWDDRRAEVLQRIAVALRQPAAVGLPVKETPEPVTATPLLAGIALQAQRAATLHYAALATLFVQHFDAQLQVDTLPVRTPSQAYFFNAYVGLLYGPWFELTRTRAGRSRLTQGYHEDLQRDTLSQAERLSALLDRSSPIGPSKNMERRAVRALQFMTHFGAIAATSNYNVLAFNELLPGVDAYQWSGDGNAAGDSLMEIYDAWCRWLCADLPSETGQRDVERIASASGALSILLASSSGVTVAIQTVGRALAHKAIATYYDVPDWQPLSDGRSLHQQADVFFDREGPALAASC